MYNRCVSPAGSIRTDTQLDMHRHRKSAAAAPAVAAVSKTVHNKIQEQQAIFFIAIHIHIMHTQFLYHWHFSDAFFIFYVEKLSGKIEKIVERWYSNSRGCSRCILLASQGTNFSTERKSSRYNLDPNRRSFLQSAQSNGWFSVQGCFLFSVSLSLSRCLYDKRRKSSRNYNTMMLC